jgi:hypothetical protein
MFSFKDEKNTSQNPYFVALVNSIFDLKNMDDPGMLLLKQKIQLKTITESAKDEIDFSFCPMNEEILIADKSKYDS